MERLSELWANHSPVMLGTIVLGLSSIGYVILKSRSDNPPKGLVYPPGPPRDPVIGNLRHFPKGDDSVYGVLDKWRKEYGDIVYLRMPGVSMVIVSSLDMVHELLSKRRITTSGRAVPYMINEMLGWSWNLTGRAADSTHEQIRQMLRRGIGPQRVSSHDPLIERSTHELLLKLNGLMGDPSPSVIDAVGHIIIELTYGKQVWDKHGAELVAINIEALDIITSTWGKVWLVDIFNQLRFVPSWMPGAEFKRLSIHSTRLVTRIRNWPYQMSKELADAHTLSHSLAADLFEEYGQTIEVKDALGTLYSGGADTTSSTVIHFLHCMLMFPKIAQRLQREIDTVVGDRLPTVIDREMLPYTEAVWKESLRWNATVPLGVAHTNIQDEVINGFFIPKGSMINANIGFILMDPKIWGDPDVFRPERHLENHDPPLPNPISIIFGFGLRVCPGRDIANRAGFHLSTTVMAIYNILPLEGKAAPDPATIEYTTLLVRFPKEFECRLIPRSEKAANLLSTLAVS